MSFNNTKELKIGKKYQYQPGRLTDFGRKEIIDVKLIEDNSSKKYYRLKFKPLQEVKIKDLLEKDGLIHIEILKEDFYFGGMPRVWDEGEYL